MKGMRPTHFAAVGLGIGALAALTLAALTAPAGGPAKRREPPPVEVSTLRPIKHIELILPPSVEPSVAVSPPAPVSQPTPKAAPSRRVKKRHKPRRPRPHAVATKAKTRSSEPKAKILPEPTTPNPTIRDPMAMPARHRALVERLWDTR